MKVYGLKLDKIEECAEIIKMIVLGDLNLMIDIRWILMSR
jgi:hypothetical protein